MVGENKYEFKYKTFESIGELQEKEQSILFSAVQAAQADAYAPYSQFRVGAAIILDSGLVISGSNQENAAFPTGICAERVALGSVAHFINKGEKILKMAISYLSEDIDISKAPALSPCGMCRQSIIEFVNRQGSSFELLMMSPNESGIIISDVTQLLPFTFSRSYLK